MVRWFWFNIKKDWWQVGQRLGCVMLIAANVVCSKDEEWAESSAPTDADSSGITWGHLSLEDVTQLPLETLKALYYFFTHAVELPNTCKHTLMWKVGGVPLKASATRCLNRAIKALRCQSALSIVLVGLSQKSETPSPNTCLMSELGGVIGQVCAGVKVGTIHTASSVAFHGCILPLNFGPPSSVPKCTLLPLHVSDQHKLVQTSKLCSDCLLWERNWNTLTMNVFQMGWFLMLLFL